MAELNDTQSAVNLSRVGDDSVPSHWDQAIGETFKHDAGVDDHVLIWGRHVDPIFFNFDL